MDPAPKTEKEIREERWRQRWNAFWTPFITLTAVVSSVAMLMVLIQTCQQRNLPVPLLLPTSPLSRPGAVKTPGPVPNDHVGDRSTIPVPAPDRQDEAQPPPR
jgi:hypothetical protein